MTFPSSTRTWGIEYRGRFTVPNPTPEAEDISGYFYYTFTDVTSSIHFDHATSTWEEGDTNLGDIAPHKVNLGINIPTNSGWNLHLRANFVSRRTLYSQNALRERGETIDPYAVIHGALSYTYGPLTVTGKVINMLNHFYFHPGVEQADSGDDFTQRSLGFRNSLIPQPGRSCFFRVSFDFGMMNRL
ncbi:MAG: hypothetical protein QGG64_15170 [Candidatus Latescibacteria bacterium]|nr:hypothetical protein [Candidatus Latescibacterota bacterium]